MVRQKLKRHNVIGVVIRSLALSPMLCLAAGVTAAFADRTSPLKPSYDFSRWDIGAAVNRSASSSPPAQKPHMVQDGFSLSLNDLTIKPGDDVALNMIHDSTPQASEKLGFLGLTGGDVTTVLFYSAGAAIGVIGSNLKVDEDSGGSSSGNTAFIEDPDNFKTPEFNNQYGLGKVGAHYAYARGHDGDGVLVSVMDTPFNTSHANLSGALIDGYNPADGSTNVALDCTGGANPCQHGTHVAGIIAARKTNQDSSMHGVAPKAKVKPVAFLNDAITTGQQQVNAFTNASGIDSSTNQQIVAMNNSWGPIAGFHSETYNGYYFKVPNETTITTSNAVFLGSKQAADADTIMVFAAGNDGWNSQTGEIYLYASPSAANPVSVASASDIIASSGVTLTRANRLDSVTAMPLNAPDTSHYVIDSAENEHMWLVVVATDQNNRITSFSNGCGVAKSFCLAAPGQNINSTDGSGSTYVELPGTSMAAPHVTGAIAILADMYPNLLERPENISQILLETATDLGTAGVDDVYGHGLLNLQAATGPLGSIDITDDHFGSSGTPYNGGAVIETPVAFGDALSGRPVTIGGVDKYDRVFMLHLPIQTVDMAGRTITQYAHEPLSHGRKPGDNAAHPRDGLSLLGDQGKGNTLSNAGLNYNTSVGSGQLNASLKLRMDLDRPHTGAGQSLGYDRYFDAMAYGGGTRERMAIDLASAQDHEGRQLSTHLRLDRDQDNRLTMISSSTATRSFGSASASLTIGGMSEEGRMMGGSLSGPLAIASTHTVFAQSKITLPLGMLGRLDGFYEYGQTTPMFVHDSLVSADTITTDTYGLTWQMETGRDDTLLVTLHRPVAVTSGRLHFNTLTGYTEDGSYKGQTLSYAMTPSERETTLLAEYHRRLFTGGQVVMGLSHQYNTHNIAGVTNTGGFMRAEMEF